MTIRFLFVLAVAVFVAGCGVHNQSALINASEQLQHRKAASINISEQLKQRENAGSEQERQSADRAIKSLCHDYLAECVFDRPLISDTDFGSLALLVGVNESSLPIQITNKDRAILSFKTGVSDYLNRIGSNISIKQETVPYSGLKAANLHAAESNAAKMDDALSQSDLGKFLRRKNPEALTPVNKVASKERVSVPVESDVVIHLNLILVPKLDGDIEVFDMKPNSVRLAENLVLNRAMTVLSEDDVAFISYVSGWLTAEALLKEFQGNEALKKAVRQAVKDRSQAESYWREVSAKNDLAKTEAFIKYAGGRFASTYQAPAINLLSHQIDQKKNPLDLYVKLKTKYKNLPLPNSLQIYFIGPDKYSPYAVKQLLAKGESEEFLAQRIISSEGKYRNFSDQEYFQLRKFGLPEKIIVAMMRSTKQVEEKERQQLLAEQERIRQQQLAAEQERQRKQAQAKNEDKGGFQWGKLAAMATGAAIGGLGKLDSASKTQIVGGMVMDSMEGQTGVSNTQAAMNQSAQFRRELQENDSRTRELYQQAARGNNPASANSQVNGNSNTPGNNSSLMPNSQQYNENTQKGSDWEQGGYLNGVPGNNEPTRSAACQSAKDNAARLNYVLEEDGCLCKQFDGTPDGKPGLWYCKVCTKEPDGRDNLNHCARSSNY